MPEIHRHAPGSFCWFELATTDQSAAKDFYASLFGWAAEDFPMGPSGVYTMFNVEGRNVSAAYTLQSDQQAQGVPPNWALYVAVENADDSAKRAAALGGRIHAAPFDVGNYGRMAVMADPAGASFCIWQPKDHQGVGITGVEGTVCWADLSTPDASAAESFYTRLFNWSVKTGEQDASGYLHIFNGKEPIGGIPPAQFRDSSQPPHWLLYFLVSKCAASVERASGLGSTVLMQPMHLAHVGDMAVLKDPQGALFALFEPLAQETA